MIQPQALIKMFTLNNTLLNRQISTITHAESLVQPENLPNSINWLVGHLVSSRSMALQRVKQEPMWSDEVRARYRNGSLPIKEDGEGVQQFETLVATYNESQERLIRGLEAMTLEDLSQYSGFGENSVGDSLAYFHFHEAYHIGQIADVATALGKETMWVN